MHTLPSGQVTSLQLGSTQYPAPLQTLSGGHLNSPVSHLATHVPLSQIFPGGQISPSSVEPLQSSSAPLHFSIPGFESGMQVVPVAVHCVRPCAQTPGIIVSHGCPPPEQVTPVIK